MPRRGENIYKRKDRRWEGRIRKPDGKYQYLYAKTYGEVKEKMKSSQKNSKPGERKRSGSVESAAVLFQRWVESGLSDRIKPSTYESYFCCMQKYVIPYFEETEDKQITVHTVSHFVNYIRDIDSISESYKRKVLSIFKTASREILKGSSEYPAVMEAIQLPKAKSKEIQVFSVEEQRLTENTALHWADRRALGIILCFYTGIRLGELCALKWSDIDIEAGTMSIVRTVSRTRIFRREGKKTALTVGTPKSQHSVRKIPLPDFLRQLVDELKPRSANDSCYILSGTHIPTDPRTYQKLYKKVLENAGVKDRKFHAIRHTFATRALELGVDIKTLSEMLGHSSVSITLNIYAHSLMEQKKIAMEKFNKMHLTHMTSAVMNAVSPS